MVRQVRQYKTATSASLQRVQPVYLKDGSSLCVVEQLCREEES